MDEKPKMTSLGGGVSNLVVRVESSSGIFVFKSSLEKLNVTENWFADRSRITRETSCLIVIAKFVGQEFAPRVIFEDHSNFACLLECAPERTVTWKHQLMSNVIDHDVIDRVSSFLVNFHSATSGRRELRVEFGDISNFVQLRISPYLVAIRKRHKTLEAQMDEIISGLTSTKLCLVHGDFSPKNILLLPDGRIWIIDCEVAHYGNPDFDIAFCSNHLILKSFHLKSLALLEETKRLWNLYWQRSEWAGRQEDFAVRVLSALMLARIDGKSPVEYLDEEKRSEIRTVAKEMVESRQDNFEELIEISRKNIKKQIRL